MVTNPTYIRHLFASAITALLTVVGTGFSPTSHAIGAENTRVRDGLVVLYEFNQTEGDVIRDSGEFGEPLDLQITESRAVVRRPGVLEVQQPTLVRSHKPARKIVDAVRESKEFAIETWVQPKNVSQSGPARIVTLSFNSAERNFTLGQDGNRLDVRLRATASDNNGLPSLTTLTDTVSDKLLHVVFTRRRTGHTRVYVNGDVIVEGKTDGEMSNWDESFQLALANELSGERPWLGTYYLVAIYSKALYAEEVRQNVSAGPGSGAPEERKNVDANLASQPATTAQRAQRGLQLLYDFDEDGGDIVHDRSQTGKPFDLRITQPKSARITNGTLEIHGETMVRTDDAVSHVSNSIKRSGGFTVEAWLRPENTDQAGPARIVSLSRDGSNRNFTLGQDGGRYDIRFRTTKTSENGIPSLSTPNDTVKTVLTHIVYTRNRRGEARIFLDGKQVADCQVAGDTSNWDESYPFVLANEHSGDRQWLGTYHLVAIYNRDLSPAEVQHNFEAGAKAATVSPEFARAPVDLRAIHFETKIAPLISRHCLECHDSPASQGGLDLSRRESALAGGDTGKALVAGNLGESLIWDSVESDTMPLDRPPLSSEEKTLLKNWINDGATWSLDFIDPAVYAHEGDNTHWVQRLTVPEYVATVRDTVGVDIAAEAQQLLPPDLRADGFSNTAYNLNVDLQHVNAYAQLAQIVVSRLDVEKFAARFSSSKKFTDDDMGKLISKLGKHLLRGPVDEQETVVYRGITTSAAATDASFEDAVGYMIEAMLQSPRFIYRIENHQGDGTFRQADDYELASRLSYIVWGAPPDSELMRAADDAELSSGGIDKQLPRMFDDPRARQRSLQFAAEWLNLGRLSNLQPDPARFPGWTSQLATDMRDETLAVFDELVWTQKRPLADLMNAPFTFVTPELARHYGLEPVSDGTNGTAKQTRYDLSQVGSRGGLLTQGSILTVGGDEASMVTRGLFVMHELLRGVVRDPPPCVDTTPVPSKPGLSQRGVSESRIANESCGGCHARFEPLAFGLERYDGLGVLHEHDEHDNELREDGQILFPGSAMPVNYQTAGELMDQLANSDRVKETLTWKLTQFALGRPLTAVDAGSVADIHKAADKNGGKYTDVIAAIVASDLVQWTRTEASQ